MNILFVYFHAIVLLPIVNSVTNYVYNALIKNVFTFIRTK